MATSKKKILTLVLMTVVVWNMDSLAQEIRPGHSDTSGWIVEFGLPGINGDIYAIAAHGPHIYVGGSFEVAGNKLVNNVAKWDAGLGSWQSLGDGVHGAALDAVPAIFAMVIDSVGNLIVGGSFSNAGSVAASSIAKWDGSDWTPVGEGVSGGAVYAMTWVQGRLYVGGSFRSAGSTPATNLAVWDGNVWAGVGGGVNGSVYVLTGLDDGIVVGGRFTHAGAVESANIAVWDGENWKTLGGGLTHNVWGGSVRALAVTEDGYLLAGGHLNLAGGIAVHNVALWNGAAWEGLGDELDGVVRALVVNGDEIVAAGDFLAVGETSATGVAVWKRGNWTPFGTMLNFNLFGYTLLMHDNYLFVGTWRPLLPGGGNPVNYFYRWSYATERWEVLGSDNTSGLNGYVFDLRYHVDHLYAVGNFDFAGAVPVHGVARWDGSMWSALEECSIEGLVRHILDNGQEGLIFVGDITAVNGIPSGRIASWDGARCSPFDPNIDGTVASAATNGHTFCLAGWLRMPGAEDVSLACWDGGAWLPLALEENLSRIVVDIDGIGGIYVAETYGIPGFSEQSRIRKYANGAWRVLGERCNGPIHAMTAANDNTVYIGGSFSTIDGIAVSNISKWDGEQWSPLGQGVNRYVTALHYDAVLYAAGEFTRAGDTPVRSVATWDGSGWHNLDQGIVGYSILAIHAEEQSVFFGGEFIGAGGRPSANIAIWNREYDVSSRVDGPRTTDRLRVQAYPNPFKSHVYVSYDLAQDDIIEVRIFDVLGRLVKAMPAGRQHRGTHSIIVHGEGLSAGLYLVKVFGAYHESMTIIARVSTP